ASCLVFWTCSLREAFADLDTMWNAAVGNACGASATYFKNVSAVTCNAPSARIINEFAELEPKSSPLI
ncbi:MAG TPA: hypothetical protein VFX46_07045, partial [Hyphomicrobiaceae bacterium]|nr:hypothetical protein [Hyphomicrobiaceae bacterium]